MERILVTGSLEDAAGVARWGGQLQQVYTLETTAAPGAIPLRLQERAGGALFSADPVEGVVVNTTQSAGISTYLEIPREIYLVTASMLGILRYRALLLNPLLRDEDCAHGEPAWCLCAQRLFLYEYAMAFEEPRVCPGCWRFYGQLCPPGEVEAVNRVVQYTADLVERNRWRREAG